MEDNERRGSEHVGHRRTESLSPDRDQDSPSRGRRSLSPGKGRNSPHRQKGSQPRDKRERSRDREESSRDRRGKSPGDRHEAFEAFDLSRHYFDSQLSQLKNDISNQSSKPKEKNVNLNKESHRIQFEFNLEILEGLESVSKQLSKPGLKSEVKELITKVKHRNKLMQIADNSPGGWSTVREYEKPSLASDSDDERKLRQAESRAIKKVKTASSKQNRFHPYKTDSRSFMQYTPTTSRDRGTRYGLPQRSNYSQLFRGLRRATPDDVCYSCGYRGHFRRQCNRFLSSGRGKPDAFGIDTRKPSGISGESAVSQ